MAQRSLTPGERAVALSVFGTSIDVDSIRINTTAWISPVGIAAPPNWVVAPDGHMYFSPQASGVPNTSYSDDFSTASLALRATFVHELAHIWETQHGQNLVVQYAPLIAGQFFGASLYSLSSNLDPNTPWGSDQLNLEQRAEIISRWYVTRELEAANSPLPSGYQPHAVYDSIFSGAPYINNQPSPSPSIPPQSPCFVAGTPILLADGTEKPIEAIAVGDQVLAFDPLQASGGGPLVPCKVTRLFTNVTSEWLVLRAEVADAGFAELTVTPGHHFLASDGTFKRIDQILSGDCKVVLAGGPSIAIQGQRLRHAEDTAHLYEQAEVIEYPVIAGLALAPRIQKGWKTYNFEVENLHTYIAAGVRVHNECVAAAAMSLDEAESLLGHAYTGSPEDTAALMDAVARGQLAAEGHYFDINDPSRFTAALSSGDPDRLVVSGNETGWLASVVRNGELEHTLQHAVDGQRVETFFDPTNQQAWSEHTVNYDADGRVIGDVFNYDTADVWSANHYLPANLTQFNEAAAQVFVGDLARQAFAGAFLDDAAPVAFSYESYGGFGAAYDFGIGSYDIDLGAGSYAIVGFQDYGYGWDATAYNYWDGWTGQYDTFQTYTFDGWSFGDWYQPVVLDLDGDGVDILPRTDSTVFFDVDDDGFREQTAWAGATDGLLVIDLGANGSATPDGTIDQAEELGFALLTADPNDTDLEALATLFDSDTSGALTAADTDWSRFRVWQDKDSDGVVDGALDTASGELFTLGYLGITSVGLASDNKAFMLSDGSRINGLAQFTINGVH